MGRILLTVLGSGVAWANPGGVCSGYLVRAGATSLLIDCGSGVLGRLRAQADPRELDAVIVSHLHADHFLDLVGLRYGIKYGGLGGDRPLRILLPPGGCDLLAELGTVLDKNDRFFADVFALEEYTPAAPITLDGVTVTPRRVQHYIPSHALRIEAGSTLVYSSDSAPCASLVEHARGADVLLCEAAMLHLGQDEPDPARRGHLTADEAGRIARDAKVGRLLITHSPFDPSDPGRAAREARARFGGPVERVVDGQTYTI
jgi:ribonuclease BN (tRNA processing enzyme)